MKSNNILKSIIDPDNIILKIPASTLVISVDTSTNILNIAGNIAILQEISKIAYIGVSKNTLQEFALKYIYINFTINDIKYNFKVEPSSTVASTSIYIINDNFNLPIDINYEDINIESFRIIANYIYGNNRISSIVTLTDSNIRFDDQNTSKKIELDLSILSKLNLNISPDDENKKEEIINFIKTVIPDKFKRGKVTENFDNEDNKNADPFFTLYWLVPLSIVICIGVYLYYNGKTMRNRLRRGIFNTSEDDDGADEDDNDNYDPDDDDGIGEIVSPGEYDHIAIDDDER